MKRMARWMAALLTGAMVTAGCAWEDTQGTNDSGVNEDANNTTDTGPQYPPGPYGINYGDTVANFTVAKVLCSGEHGQGRAWSLDEYLGGKALLVTVHAGW